MSADRELEKHYRFAERYGLGAQGKTMAEVLATATPEDFAAAEQRIADFFKAHPALAQLQLQLWRPATAAETSDRQYVLVVAERRSDCHLEAERLYAADAEHAATVAAAWLDQFPAAEWRHDKATYQGAVVPLPS